VLLAIVAGSLLLGGSAQAKDAAVSNSTPPEKYCEQEGGQLEYRRPFYGTNGSDALRLAGARLFCQFTASDGSRIHVMLSTLYTAKPTLAALAYYAEVQPGSCNGNPASCYCSYLGGAEIGQSGAGGGWAEKNTTDEVLEACIFPDLSSIDSWGLFYHSAGIIRGIDLNGVLRYPNPYPSNAK
jgi:putative hemolysin